MKKLCIIRTGSTFASTAAQHGDFTDLVRRGLELAPELIEVIDAAGGAPLPAPENCAGAVITGAHCMVTDDLPWSLAIEAWLPEIVAAEVPLLGICYGHQLLGRAMGGRVGYHPQGREVGTVPVRRLPAADGDPLFDRLPESFPAHATHAQTVLELPPGALLLAENDFEPHHAFRLGRCAWGVQFHPEYLGGVMRDYILAQAKELTGAGHDVARLLGEVRETREACGLLAGFARLALADDTVAKCGNL